MQVSRHNIATKEDKVDFVMKKVFVRAKYHIGYFLY